MFYSVRIADAAHNAPLIYVTVLTEKLTHILGLWLCQKISAHFIQSSNCPKM